MRTYRFYFFADDNHTIRGRFDFEADDDDRAAETAEILFQACGDRCHSWGIWEGTVLVSSGPVKLGAPLRASVLAEQRQENILQCEEAILDSEWAVASSQRLLVELNKLKASRQGAARYSL